MMVAFNCFLLLLLVTPLGTDNDSGNRSWINTGIVMVQPAEICKITYVVIMASVMSAHQNRISSLPSVMHMCLHLGLLVGLNMVLSGDAGVSLIFVFIFIGMAFGGGVSLWWFVLAIGLIVAAFPILWQFLGEYQQNRFLILVDDTIDPMGINERYHSMMNLRSLTGGGLTGQGLFNGNRTQSGSLFADEEMKPALIPIITVMGMQIAMSLGGAVLTETTFGWRGLGFMLQQYLGARDFVAVQGIVVLLALIVAVTNFVVDVVAALVDPRVRY